MIECIQAAERKCIFIEEAVNQEDYHLGDVIEATVEEKTEAVTKVLLDQQMITIDTHVRITEAVGEKIHLEVVQANKNSLQLKYLPSSQPKTFRQVVSNVKKKVLPMETEQGEICRKAIKSLDVEQGKQLEATLKEIEQVVKELVETMTNQDVKKMLEQDLSPEKISLEMMAKVVKHNKEALRYQKIEVLKEEVEKEVQQLRDQYQKSPEVEKIVQALKEHNLPVRNKQVEKVVEMLDKIQKIENQASEKWINLLKLGGSTTVKEAYKASHTPVIQQSNKALEKVDVEDLVSEHLKKLEVQPTKKNQAVAIQMLKHNLDITKEHIIFALNPKEKINAEPVETTIGRIVDLLEQQIPIETLSIKLEGLEREEVVKVKTEVIDQVSIKSKTMLETKQLMLALSQVTDTQILSASMDETQVNLEKLFQAPKEVVTPPTSQQAQKALVNKIKLEEIRLKMTIEAATKLRDQGLEIETEPLVKVVEALKGYERQMVIDIAKIHDIIPTQQVVDQAVETLDYMQKLATLPKEVVVEFAIIKKAVCLKDLTRVKEKNQMPHFVLSENRPKHYVMHAYELSGTKVRKDLGDKVEKIFDQIQPLLEKMAIEPTTSAIKAVESLIRNQMPITEKAVTEIQLIQAKATRITKNMHPHLVLEMIKSGITPLELDLDETLQFIDQYALEFGETEPEKMSRLIWELEQSGRMTEAERTSLMGIYRTFDTVVRAQGAATGFLIKNNQSLTIDHLFEAAKFIQRTGQIKASITAEIDDNFGRLEKINYPEMPIKEQVKLALKDREMTNNPSPLQVEQGLKKSPLPLTGEQAVAQALMQLTLRTFVQEMGHGKMIQTEPEKLMHTALENLLENWQMAEKESLVVPHGTKPVILQPILAFIRETPEILETFIKNKMPVNKMTLENAIALNKEPFMLVQHLRQLMEEDMSQITREQVSHKLEEVSKKLLKGEVGMKELKQMVELITQEIYASQEADTSVLTPQNNGATSIIHHTQMLQQQEDYYQIPIMMNGELHQLNMYIHNKPEGGDLENIVTTTVFMKFETKNLGQVCTYLTIKGNQIQVNIQSDIPEDQGLLQSFEAPIRELISKTNFSLDQIGYKKLWVKDPIQASAPSTLTVPTTKLVEGRFETVG